MTLDDPVYKALTEAAEDIERHAAALTRKRDSDTNQLISGGMQGAATIVRERALQYVRENY